MRLFHLQTNASGDSFPLLEDGALWSTSSRTDDNVTIALYLIESVRPAKFGTFLHTCIRQV
jgi:hypothetical protein